MIGSLFSIVVWDGFNVSTQIQSACETDFMHQGDFIHKERIYASDTGDEKNLTHQKQGAGRI